MSTELNGACLCGAVTITGRASKKEIDACHCGMSRKWAGSPLLAINCDGGVTLTGEDNISEYQSSEWAKRGFCKKCGTHLYYKMDEPLMWSIPASFFDNAEDFDFQMEIFIDRKPDYYGFAGDRKRLTEAEVMKMFGAG